MAVPIIAGGAALAKLAAKPTLKLVKKLIKKYKNSSSVTQAAVLSGGAAAVVLPQKKKDIKKKKPKPRGYAGTPNKPTGFKGHF